MIEVFSTEQTAMRLLNAGAYMSAQHPSFMRCKTELMTYAMPSTHSSMVAYLPSLQNALIDTLDDRLITTVDREIHTRPKAGQITVFLGNKLRWLLGAVIFKQA